MPRCGRCAPTAAPARCLRHEVLATHGARSRHVLEEILAIGRREPREMTGDDLVHVDLTAANVLFDDHDRATGVVDWNPAPAAAIGSSPSFRPGSTGSGSSGPRTPTRWAETAAAVHLDEILAHRIAPATLRLYWAHWMLRQLTWAVRSTPPDVVDWHLDMIETRLA